MENCFLDINPVCVLLSYNIHAAVKVANSVTVKRSIRGNIFVVLTPVTSSGEEKGIMGPLSVVMTSRKYKHHVLRLSYSEVFNK